MELFNVNADAANNALIQNAIAEGIEEMLNSEEPKAPTSKKGKDKPKAAPKAPEAAPKKAVNNVPKEPKEPKEKPAPVILKGASGDYELKAGADLKAIQAAAKATQKSLEAIQRKDKDLLKHYLGLGEFQSGVSKFFASTKLYGQFLAEELPASQALDPALRSNCKWLWEALNMADHEGSDLLNVFKINRIEDYKSQNPTVIKRDYKAIKAEADKAKAAEDAGLSVEEMEAEAEEKAKANAEEAKALMLQFVKHILSVENKDEAEADLADVLSEALFGKKKEALEAMNSLLP
jgi:hypothetical protein